MTALISLIVPVYNVEGYLDRLERSLFHQTYHNLEIVLVDDGSTDSSGDVCDSWKDKHSDYKVSVIHQKNAGLSAARNTGIEHAAGDWLIFMDSDDGVASDYVESLYTLVTDFECQIGTVDILPIRDDSPYEKLDRQYSGIDLAGRMESKSEFFGNLLYHRHNDVAAYAKIVHRDLFNDVRFPMGKLFEDTSTTYKLFLKCPNIAVSHAPKYFYYIRQGSITNSLYSARQLDYLEATDEMCDAIKKACPSLNRACEERQTFARLSVLTKTLHYNLVDKQAVQRVQDQLVNYIKVHASTILKNSNSPTRDKAGVLLVKLLGKGGFIFFWKVYGLIRGK